MYNIVCTTELKDYIKTFCDINNVDVAFQFLKSLKKLNKYLQLSPNLQEGENCIEFLDFTVDLELIKKDKKIIIFDVKWKRE